MFLLPLLLPPREDYCFGPKDPLIPEDAEMDLCTSVPTHLEITIFHSVAGEINGFVFHQITGMRIR